MAEKRSSSPWGKLQSASDIVRGYKPIAGPNQKRTQQQRDRERETDQRDREKAAEDAKKAAVRKQQGSMGPAPKAGAPTGWQGRKKW